MIWIVLILGAVLIAYIALRLVVTWIAYQVDRTLREISYGIEGGRKIGTIFDDCEIIK